MRPMKPKVILPVRLPIDLKRWIQAQAKREHKTPSMWCWLAMEDYRENYVLQDEIRSRLERERQARQRRVT